MTLTQVELFQFALPAIGCFFLGAILFYKEFDFRLLIKKINPNDASRLGHLLLAISVSVELLSGFVSAFASIDSVTQPLRYVAFSCYIFSTTPLNIFLMVLIYSSLLRYSVSAGLFLVITTWSAVFFFLYSIKFQLSFPIKFLVVLITIPLIIVIQSVKKDYRRLVYRGKGEAGIELITEIAIQNQLKEKKTFANSAMIVSTLDRLNQSWHLSKVMSWVPLKERFAEGKELMGDIKSAVLPRVLYQNKKYVGDRVKFKQYTGIKLRKASMTVGVLGDFYLNFGIVGGCIGLFIFGAFMAWSLSAFTKKYVLETPINLLWIPFIFIIWVSANDEFYTVINTFVKSFFVFIGINFLYKQIWPSAQSEEFKTEVGTDDAK